MTISNIALMKEYDAILAANPAKRLKIALTVKDRYIFSRMEILDVLVVTRLSKSQFKYVARILSEIVVRTPFVPNDIVTISPDRFNDDFDRVIELLKTEMRTGKNGYPSNQQEKK